MAFIDDDGNRINPAAPYNPAPAPVAPVTPPPPVATAAPYVAAPAPPVGGVPSQQQMQDWILNSPLYKQGMETINNAYTQNVARENTLYGLNSSYKSPAQTYTPETIPASFYEQIALEKEKAAHEYALQQEALPYQLGARGMLSSGHAGFMEGEQQYGYDTLLKDIDLQKRAREEAVAQANARGAASVAQANAANAANKAISDQIAATQHGYRLEDMTQQQAQDRNKLLMDVSNYYQDLWWDPNTNQYRGPTV